MPDELHDDSSLKAAPTNVGLKSLTLASSSRESVQLDDGCSQWLQALDRLLPGVLVHNAPMVSGVFALCACSGCYFLDNNDIIFYLYFQASIQERNICYICYDSCV